MTTEYRQVEWLCGCGWWTGMREVLCSLCKAPMAMDIRNGMFEAYWYAKIFPLSANALMGLPFGWRDKGGHKFTPEFCRKWGERTFWRGFDAAFFPAMERLKAAIR